MKVSVVQTPHPNRYGNIWDTRLPRSHCTHSGKNNPKILGSQKPSDSAHVKQLRETEGKGARSPLFFFLFFEPRETCSVPRGGYSPKDEHKSLSSFLPADMR